jgi:RNA polymerase sigma factor (sigma-70 family)
MQIKSDAQLLHEYAEHGCEAAFTEIVSRHMDLVYSAAVRQVESPDLAHDVAQTVFTDLARKAGLLIRDADHNASLVGWLYRSTRFEALNLMRGNRRRQARERQAMQDLTPVSETSPDWERIRPALDVAMAELRDHDRDALLMRFFKNQDFRSIGAAFGVSDNTAQQRVIRALETLRKSLAHRGITTSAAALSIAISGNAVQAAPVGLAVAVSTSAMLARAAIATSTAAVAKTIAMTTLQKTLITITIAASAGTGIYEASQVAHLRHEFQTLQQQQTPLAEQIQQLQRERDSATNQLAAMADEISTVDRDRAELLRLRSETGMLRQQTNRLGTLVQGLTKALSSTTASAAPLVQTNFPRSSWAFGGYTTPEATLESYMWAKSRGDVKTAFAAATPEMQQAVRESYFKDKSDAEISALLIENAKNQAGIQILKKMDTADDQVIFQVHLDGMPDKSYSLLTLRKLDGEWKVSSAEERSDQN